MTKQRIHINLNELKEIIKQQIHESYLGDYGMSGNCVFEPGWNADISEEESEELNRYMQPSYSISFNAENSGGDGRNTPDESRNIPSDEDIEAVRADIANIPNEHLRQVISDEFDTWLANCEPDMDYNEPDIDGYKDEVYEDSGYGQDEYWFRHPLHDEPGDEHYDNPEQIAMDNDEAWRDHDAMFKKYDPRSTQYSDDPTMFPDSNRNTLYQYTGRDNALNAQQNDEPVKRWYGQTERSTNRETGKAAQDWFPADFDDTQYTDSTYKVNKYGEVNENQIKSYFKSLIRETLEDMDQKEFVIQTRTGGYLLDIKDDSASYDENTLVLSGLVGRSSVAITVNRDDYQRLVNNGESCDASYKILNRGEDSTTENPCTLSVYTA